VKPRRGKDADALVFGPLVRVYMAASKAVWNDPAVWIEERDNSDQRLLQWPRPHVGTAYEKLLQSLFNADVDVILILLESRGHPALPALPPEVDDPKFQVVLRVAHRAFLRGKEAIERKFGGYERVTGLKEFRNDVTALGVDLAIRSGLRREMGDQAFTALGISRSAAYRAMNRPRRR
jgi:hypothetical protein